MRWLLLLCLLSGSLAAKTLSVADFGADASGAKDASPAFNALWAAAAGERQVQVIIPAGRYRLESRVTFGARGNDSNYGLSVTGAGEDVTELQVANADGGLAFVGESLSRLSVTVSGLSLVALSEPAGTALSFDTANPGDQHSRQFNAHDLLIRGERFDHGSFARGLAVRNAWYPRLTNVKVTGRYGPRPPRRELAEAILLEDCYSPLLADCYVWDATDGLVYRGVRTAPEDGIVRDSYFVGCQRAVTVDLKRDVTNWEEPAFHLTGCHLAYADRGLTLQGVRQAFVRDCLFYCTDRGGAILSPDRTVRDFEPVDIDLVYAAEVQISGNIFTEPSNPKRVAVRIGPDSGVIRLSDNQFNLQGTAVRNESKLASFATGNLFGGRRDFTAGGRRYDDRTGSLVVKDAN